MIRAVFCFIEIFLFLVLGLPVLLVLWIYQLFNPHRVSERAQWYVAWILGVITRTALGGKKLTVLGLENIPRDEGVVFMGNHRSYFDIICTYPILPVQTGFLAKDGLYKVPSLRRWMQLLHCQFLDRKDIRKGMETIKTCTELVKNGTSIWVFPEGSRTKNPDQTALSAFHAGSFKIAERANAYIVPVAIYGTDVLWENQFPAVRPTDITIEFGKPFRASELPQEMKKKVSEYTVARIREMLVEEERRRA